jgi:hypothetical protein
MPPVSPAQPRESPYHLMEQASSTSTRSRLSSIWITSGCPTIRDLNQGWEGKRQTTGRSGYCPTVIKSPVGVAEPP